MPYIPQIIPNSFILQPFGFYIISKGNSILVISITNYFPSFFVLSKTYIEYLIKLQRLSITFMSEYVHTFFLKQMLRKTKYYKNIFFKLLNNKY